MFQLNAEEVVFVSAYRAEKNFRTEVGDLFIAYVFILYYADSVNVADVSVRHPLDDNCLCHSEYCLGICKSLVCQPLHRIYVILFVEGYFAFLLDGFRGDGYH